MAGVAASGRAWACTCTAAAAFTSTNVNVVVQTLVVAGVVRHVRLLLISENCDVVLSCRVTMCRGNWEDDVRHGSGEMMYADGAVYNGDWRFDMRNGKGKHIFPPPTNEVYEGEVRSVCRTPVRAIWHLFSGHSR